MVIVFCGGLGNQLFQYSFYLSLKDKGFKVKYDTSLYEYQKMHNGFELDSLFNLNKKDHVSILFPKLHLIFLRLMLKLNLFGLVYRDKYYFLRDINKYIYLKRWLYGYWQSEKYFIESEKKIRSAIQFRNIDEKNSILAGYISSVQSVSLHIRRGDYVDNPLYDGICIKNYYEKAIDYICHVVDKPFFYIFSDDILWSKIFLEAYPIEKHFVDLNYGANSFKDLYLMSCCKHNIIANSSFSWWGAWLNQNSKKIVVAPLKWFNSPNNPSADILPDSWVKL